MVIHSAICRELPADGGLPCALAPLGARGRRAAGGRAIRPGLAVLRTRAGLARWLPNIGNSGSA